MKSQNSKQVRGERLWESIQEMARIGATAKGGVKRLAFSAEDYAGRDHFVDQCQELHMLLHRDTIGNIFATMQGREPDLPLVMVGSHLDTQPTGGKYDGALGVLAALEIARVVYESGKRPLRSLQLVAFANEEGARFSPPMMGSGVFSGHLSLDKMLAMSDSDGVTIQQALSRDEEGDFGERPSHPIHCFFEYHIEQGPILEANDTQIGIVTGAQAQRWYTVQIQGQEAHAGPTPMTHRQDALLGAAELALGVERIAKAHAPDGRGTVGTLSLSPFSPNVIPGQVKLTIDTRHPSDEALLAMKQAIEETAVHIARERSLEIEVNQLWHTPTTPFNTHLQNRLRHLAEMRGYTHQPIWSGAGHDAMNIANMGIPTAMLFIPTKDGISHNESESIKKEDAIAGCQLLCDAVVEQLNTPP